MLLLCDNVFMRLCPSVCVRLCVYVCVCVQGLHSAVLEHAEACCTSARAINPAGDLSHWLLKAAAEGDAATAVAHIPANTLFSSPSHVTPEKVLSVAEFTSGVTAGVTLNQPVHMSLDAFEGARVEAGGSPDLTEAVAALQVDTGGEEAAVTVVESVRSVVPSPLTVSVGDENEPPLSVALPSYVQVGAVCTLVRVCLSLLGTC